MKLIFCLGCLCGLGIAGASATNLELVVRERGGSTLSGPVISLTRLGDPHHREWRKWRRQHHGKVLDSQGKASFENVPAGTYRVVIRRLAQQGLIPLDKNPLSPPPTVTIRPGEPDLSIPIEVWRGHPVRIFLDILEPEYLGFQAHVVHRGTGKALDLRFPRDRNDIELILPKGLWQISVPPVQGYLLEAIDLDGQALAGKAAILELNPQSTSTFITFRFGASCLVEGKVIYRSGANAMGLKMRAKLIQPGSWIQSALDRGVDIPRSAETLTDNHGEYAMHLPDGIWQIEPDSGDLLYSDPESRTLDISPGDTEVADFTVKLKDDKSKPGSALTVSVKADPSLEGRDPQILGAAHAKETDSEDVSESAAWTGLSRLKRLHIRGLEDGDYVVAAAHADYLEGRLQVKGYRSSERNRKILFVKLKEGGSFLLAAEDTAGKRKAGVELKVQRVDELPDLLVNDPAFLKAKSERTLISDHSGRAKAAGFYPGIYTLSAQMGGAEGAQSRVDVRLADGGDWQKEIELTLEEAQALEIEARERPAAMLQTRMQCSDAWTLPDAVAVKILDAGNPSGSPVLLAERLLLGGEDGDRLSLGPLDNGVWLIGVRPEGFERWTWVYGADAPERAEGIVVGGAGGGESSGASRRVDLGGIEVECRPAVDLTGETRTGLAFPEPGTVESRFSLRDPLDGTLAIDPPSVRDGLETWHLRDLPHGKVVLDVTLSHPHFLPTSTLQWSLPLDLVPGSFDDLVLEIENLGGAVDLRWPEPVQIRLDREGQDREGFESLVLDHPPSGKVLPATSRVPSLVPGPWRVSLCQTQDKDCLRPDRQWQVEIEAGETLRLPATKASP